MAQTYVVEIAGEDEPHEIVADTYKSDQHFVTFWRDMTPSSDRPVASFRTIDVMSIMEKKN